jgi:hypothetical protein
MTKAELIAENAQLRQQIEILSLLLDDAENELGHEVRLNKAAHRWAQAELERMDIRQRKAGDAHRKRGAKSHAKMLPEIQKRQKQGMKNIAIAAELGISESKLYRILRKS